jgi:peroxiredoxin Q/BCP
MPTHLQVGDKAPQFKGKDQNGKIVSLADYKGTVVAVYFYPEDDTSVCTVQGCSIRDYYKELKKAGITVIGISPDGVASHKAFAEKYKLPFILVADEKKEILAKYGTFGEKNMYGNVVMGVHRNTFLIDSDGIIRKIFLKPKNKMHGEEILKVAKELGLVK